MGIWPFWRAAIFLASLSTHITVWPISAKHTAATNPTYPQPTTAIFTEASSGSASGWGGIISTCCVIYWAFLGRRRATIRVDAQARPRVVWPVETNVTTVEVLEPK